MQVRLRTVLLIATAVILVAMIVVRAWWQVRALDEALAGHRVLAQQDDRLSAVLSELERNIDTLQQGSLLYLSSGDASARPAHELTEKETERLLARLRPLVADDPTLLPTLDELEATLARRTEEEDVYARIRSVGPLDEATLREAFAAGRRRGDALYGHLDALHRRLEQRRGAEADVFRTLRSEFLRQTVLATGVAVVMLLLVYLVIQRLVEVPLARLSQAARALERGRTVPIPVQGVEETQDLGRVIRQLAESLREERLRDARHRELVLALSGASDLEGTARIALEAVQNAYGILAGAIWLSEGPDGPTLLATRGLDRDTRVGGGDDLVVEACRDRRVMRVGGLDDPSAYTIRTALADLRPRRLIVAPLVHRDDCIGVIELLLGAASDISDADLELLTERVARALHLARATDAADLADQRNRLATIANALADPLLFADATGIVRLSNHAASDLGDLVGTSLSDVLDRVGWATFDGTPPAEAETIDAVLAGGRPVVNLPRRLVDRHGAMRWVLASILPTAGDARGDGVVLALHDVTREYSLREGLEHANAELTSANASLRAREAELARASQMKNEFVATMSHELRTPLNAILGFTDALLAGSFGALATDQVRAVDDVNVAGRQLLLLIDDVIDLARVEAGALTIHTGRVDLARPVREAASLTRDLAAQRGITVEDRVPADTLFALADPDRVRQVMLNLLGNALKFTHRGGRVTLTAGVDEEGMIEVSVADTGIGIDEADQDKLFQVFSQIDSGARRKYPGTGLGLAISRRLVLAMGGDIRCESQLGKGSTFRFTLPVDDQAPGRESVSTRVATLPDPPVTAEPDLVGPRRALVVDDREVNRRVIASMLRPPAWKVMDAATGAEALWLARVEQPSVVLMDIEMPEVDGLATIEAFRADPQLRDIPIVAVTAHAVPEDEARMLAAGCAGYLSKPVGRQRLLSVLDRIVRPGIR